MRTSIQLVDLPAITAPEVSSWLPNIVKNADLLLVMVDATQDPAASGERHRMAGEAQDGGIK